MCDEKRVLVRMIEFINNLVTHSFNYTQITADLHTPHNSRLHAHTNPLLVMQLKHSN
jgi:hypothetical protein